MIFFGHINRFPFSWISRKCNWSFVSHNVCKSLIKVGFQIGNQVGSFLVVMIHAVPHCCMDKASVSIDHLICFLVMCVSWYSNYLGNKFKGFVF